eukprot:TRINITY_DN12369_c0_g1_i1.p1 TRINITY_DN12369_c0_g1~~TRINITY_DN12369_c0_g1_i1.p1  ORF type:complete len:226 (+),score=35.40 TRINITY_DN12369_c0_g1_i1:100-777(+)
MACCSTEMAALLRGLKPGSSVAVVTLLGSLCPVTLGHVECFVEAARMLRGEEGVRRPSRLPGYHLVIGFISLNGDGHVGRKMAAAKCQLIPRAERALLVDLATREYPWLEYTGSRTIVQDLAAAFPDVRLTRFTMNGADDVCKYRKWTTRGPHERMITMGRPGYTQKVRDGMSKAGIDEDDEHFILCRELPPISSTEARDALARGDKDTALRFLAAPVVDRLLDR